MSLFWKVSAGIIISVILILTVEQQEKDLALLVLMAVCVMTSAAALSFLEPVLDFLHQIESMVNISHEQLPCLLKMTGVGIVSEVISNFCLDSGHASLAKSMQLLATTVILNLSIPVFEQLLYLLRYTLGGL